MSRVSEYFLFNQLSQTGVYLYLLFYGLSISAIVLTTLKVFLTQRQFSAVSALFYLDSAARFYFFFSSLALIGIPPFSGFVIKFVFTVLVLLKNNIFILFLFFTYTVVSIYFYLRLVKLSLAKKPTTHSLKTLLSSKKLFGFLEAFFLTFFLFFNIFFICFFKDFFFFFFN